MNIHLIDGTYELFRMYFGAPSSKTDQGNEVGATRAFLRNLYKFIKNPTTTHIAIAFDHVIESFRNELFDGYKVGDGIDPDLFSQFPLAEEAAEALGIEVWPMIELEADDGIAGGAYHWMNHPDVKQILICSPDKDLMQCVRGKKVVVWDRRKDEIFDEEGVWKKFGVGPQSIPDYLALVGDSADGIPGLTGWGAKSTATLLATYTHLENIPDDHAQWSIKVRGAEKLARTFREHKEDAFLYRNLATLRRDKPSSALEDIEWRGVDSNKLITLCKKLNDDRFLKQIESSS